MKKPSSQTIRKMLDVNMQAIRNPWDVTGTLEAIAGTARSAFGADVVAISVINPITARPNITVSEIVTGDLLTVHHDSLSSMMMVELVLQEGLWFAETRELAEKWLSNIVGVEAIESIAAVVLQEEYDTRVFGVLFLYFRKPQKFDEDAAKSLQNFAVQTALVLHEKWLNYHYHQVDLIQQEINKGFTKVEDLFNILLLYITQILDTTYSLLLAVYPLQGQIFDVWVNEGERTLTQDGRYLEEGVCEYVVRTKKSVYIKHLSLEEENLEMRPQPVEGTEPKEFYIFLPLIFRGEVIGVLSIQHAEPNAYHERDLPPFILLANYTALALRNLSLYSNLHRLQATGQELMETLGSEQALSITIDRIRRDALADIAVLHPYDKQLGKFLTPPLVAADILSARIDGMDIKQPETTVSEMLQQKEPIFVRDNKVVFPQQIQDDFTLSQRDFVEREYIRSIVAVTLGANHQIGVLLLYFRQLQRFDEAQRLFIAALTNSAALAIRDVQFIDTLILRHAQEREILEHIEYELRHSLDLEHILTTILEQANTLLHAEGASIFLYDEETQMLEVKAVLLPHGGTLQSLRIPLEDSKGITRLALTRKLSMRVDNVHDPEWRDVYISAESSHHFISELDVPFFSDEDEAIGVLNFESTREGAFSADDEEFLNTLAEHIALAVKHARDYDEQKRLIQEEAALNQISKEMIGTLDPAVNFRTILQYALDLTHAAFGSLHLYDPETQMLTIVEKKGVDSNLQHLQQGLHQGLVGYAARNQVLLNVDPTLPQWRDIYVEFVQGIRSELAVPMLAGEELRGVLNVESRKPRCFTKNHEKLLTGLANQAVVALEHVERHQNALRERKRFELLYRVTQELGKLVELEQIEEAYAITQRISEEYGQWHVHILRNGVSIPDATPASRVFPIELNEDRYGHLVLLPDVTIPSSKVDRPFFEGLAQQLASTLLRLETTFKQREHEKQALSNEEMVWGGSLILEIVHKRSNSIGLVKSYVNDIRWELNRFGVTSPHLESKLNRIVHAAQKVLAMNNDIDNVMRTVGGEALESESLLPCDLFDDVIKEIQEERTLSLYTIKRVGCEEPLRVRAIRTIVVSILHNLVMNAINAMPKGGAIMLRAYRDGRFIALEVTDTGKGIPTKLHQKIFELGYSGKGGTGFGLWSAQHGSLRCLGDLQLVSSQPGQGSTFRLRLPSADGIGSLDM